MSTAIDETLSPAEADAFRAKVRDFLSKHATGSERGVNSIATGREFGFHCHQYRLDDHPAFERWLASFPI